MIDYRLQKEQFDSLQDLIYAVSTKYTLPYKEACRTLKCSRSYAQKYIRPHVPCVYLSNGKGTDRPNYARLVSMAVNSMGEEAKMLYSNESIYLDEKAFNDFILRHVMSCTKRSKKVYNSYFVKKARADEYYEEFFDLCVQLNRCTRSERKKLYNTLDTLYVKYADNEFVGKVIPPNIVYQTKRTEAEPIDVPIPINVPIKEWKTVSSLTDYGDVEETIYRDLFKNGCIRMEVILPDKHGEVGKKGMVYYVEDPEPVHPLPASGDFLSRIFEKYKDAEDDLKTARIVACFFMSDFHFTIKQSAWMEYNSLIGRTAKY